MFYNILQNKAPGRVVEKTKKTDPKQVEIKAAAEMFTTKIQFVKPQQRKSEESPCSIDSQDRYEEILPKESILNSGLTGLKSSKNSHQIDLNFNQAESNIHKEKAKIPEITENNKTLVVKAKAEIQALKAGNQKLKEKLLTLEDSMKKMEDANNDDFLTLNSIELKLEKLENQQLIPEEDSRFPMAVQKISFLESEIVKLKSLKETSVFQYEEQLKDVYHKLKDLQECNEILNEMVLCFKKEPIYNENDIKNAESLTDKAAKEILGTIKVPGLTESEEILKEAYEKKEQLLHIKNELEKQYKSILDDKNNMALKSKKLALEFELSMNHSQLASINNKIKRYVPDA